MDSEMKLPSGRRDLILGDSLRNNKDTSFHGIKYDFKPSTDGMNNESATVKIDSANKVTLNYAQQSDNEGSADFMYTGTMRTFTKEYFLVIDHVTGDVTLEKLTGNIQLKRTKVANNKSKNQNGRKTGMDVDKDELDSPNEQELNGDDHSISKKKTKRKQKTKENVLSEDEKKHGSLQSPSRVSPSGSSKNQTNDNYKVPGFTDSSETSNTISNPNLSDEDSSMSGFENLPSLTNTVVQDNDFEMATESTKDAVGTISTSDSESDSDSDSGSESSSGSSASSDDEKKAQQTAPKLNGSTTTSYPTSLPNLTINPSHQLLNEDLNLSESGSDSD